MDTNRLRIAVQKSGRLAEKSFEILKAAGLKLRYSKNDLYCRVQNMDIDLLLIRDDDIPELVNNDVCDLGIVGGNVVAEFQARADEPENIRQVETLGFADCRLDLAVPKDWNYRGPQDLEGKVIATSYPALTKAFIGEHGLNTQVVEMSGAVELAPRLGIADLICDLVSTGATLEANNLKPVSTLYSSQAIMIGNLKPLNEAKQAVFARLLQRVRGVLASRENKYVMMNAPKASVPAISALLPGASAPTVIQLAGREDQVAIHAVCAEGVFWETMEKLRDVGASAILVLPIEKMMA